MLASVCAGKAPELAVKIQPLLEEQIYKICLIALGIWKVKFYHLAQTDQWFWRQKVGLWNIAVHYMVD